jgi:hypothetical protein
LTSNSSSKSNQQQSVNVNQLVNFFLGYKLQQVQLYQKNLRLLLLIIKTIQHTNSKIRQNV